MLGLVLVYVHGYVLVSLGEEMCGFSRGNLLGNKSVKFAGRETMVCKRP